MAEGMPLHFPTIDNVEFVLIFHNGVMLVRSEDLVEQVALRQFKLSLTNLVGENCDDFCVLTKTSKTSFSVRMPRQQLDPNLKYREDLIMVEPELYSLSHQGARLTLLHVGMLWRRCVVLEED